MTPILLAYYKGNVRTVRNVLAFLRHCIYIDHILPKKLFLQPFYNHYSFVLL